MNTNDRNGRPTQYSCDKVEDHRLAIICNPSELVFGPIWAHARRHGRCGTSTWVGCEWIWSHINLRKLENNITENWSWRINLYHLKHNVWYEERTTVQSSRSVRRKAGLSCLTKHCEKMFIYCAHLSDFQCLSWKQDQKKVQHSHVSNLVGKSSFRPRKLRWSLVPKFPNFV